MYFEDLVRLASYARCHRDAARGDGIQPFLLLDLNV